MGNGEMPATFGIDFGTTNTRVAYFDGKHIQLVPFTSERDISFQVPSLVRYVEGHPTTFGLDARDDECGVLPSDSIKWLLVREQPIEIDGCVIQPFDIAVAFFKYIREQVTTLLKRPMSNVALTIPVNYPTHARVLLQRACLDAGIDVKWFFYEPVAAIYCDLVAHREHGTTAVFDWGGGSLDIAIVEIKDDVALTRGVDGWHEGGEAFDRLICMKAVDSFLKENPDLEFTSAELLDQTDRGRFLQRRAESVKQELSRNGSTTLSVSSLIGNRSLRFPLTVQDFENLIDTDVTKGICLLEKGIRTAGISNSLLTKLFLSGGTCNIPLVKRRLSAEVAGDLVADQISIPRAMKVSNNRHSDDGLSDIGNATAVGAALLAVYGSAPVLASDIGIRLASVDDYDAFCTVLHKESTIDFGLDNHSYIRKERFFITDGSAGVARLLVCERSDEIRQPQGRLLRVIPIPIERQENFIEVEFCLKRNLVLEVSAYRVHSSSDSQRVLLAGPEPIHNVNYGFRMPSNEKNTR